MNSHQLWKILDQVFREQAPKAYQEMQRQGELAAYLDNLTSAAIQSIYTATEQQEFALITAGSPTYEDDSIKRVQKIEMARKTAEEVALSQAMEELKEAEDEAEPDEPMSLYDLTGDYWRDKMAQR
ncbi:hypothetical protein ACWKWV_06625 [Castellaniella ginsengisoli]